MRQKCLVLCLALAGLILVVPSAQASCPSALPINHCGFPGGSIKAADPLADHGGSWWILGAGNPTLGAGVDSGTLAAAVVDPMGLDWLTDFIGTNDTRCFLWDWSQAGSDGCAAPAVPSQILVALITDTSNNYALMSVAGGNGFFDFDAINNGQPDLDFGGTANAVPLAPIPTPNITNSVYLNPSTIQVTVADPGPVNAYDDIGGGRSTIYFQRLTANGSTVGLGPGTYQVPNGSQLCWEIDTNEGFGVQDCVLAVECPTPDDTDGDGVLDCIDNCPGIQNPGQVDQDQDGLGDLCDSCPLDPFNDIDGDNVCGDIDNCPTVSNPNQRDVDDDGAGNDCDCARNDATVFAIPPDLTGLSFATDAVTLSWDSAIPLGGSATVHDLVRSALVGPLADSCILSGSAAATAADPTIPGQTGWIDGYVVRGKNSCGVGTYGFTTGGGERVLNACP